MKFNNFIISFLGSCFCFIFFYLFHIHKNKRLCVEIHKLTRKKLLLEEECKKYTILYSGLLNPENLMDLAKKNNFILINRDNCIDIKNFEKEVD